MADPVQPVQTLRPQQGGMIPAAVEELRRYARLLQQNKPRTNPFYTWANGLDDLSRGVFSGLADRQANALEQQGRESGARDVASAHSQFLTPGQPAASGGAAPAAPFTRDLTPQTGIGAGTPDLKDFIKQREGFRSAPYPDGKQVSIGYGTKAQPGEMSISRENAEARLNKEVGNARATVDAFASNLPPQVRDALTDLTYNTGTAWQQAGLGQAVKAGDWQTAGQLFQQYNKANGAQSPGLTARRQALAPAFTNPDGTMLFQNLRNLPTPQVTAQRATAATPAAAQGQQGMPQPLTSPIAQMTPEAFQRLMANPWVSEAEKNMMLQNLYKRGEVQSMPVEGGTLQYDAQGRRQFIPQPRFGKRKIGDIEYETVQRFNPATKDWTETPFNRQGPAGTVAPAAPGAPVPPAAPAPRPAVPVSPVGAPVAAPIASGAQARPTGAPATAAPPTATPNAPPPPTAAAPMREFPWGGSDAEQQEWINEGKARAKGLETAATKQAEADTNYYNALATGTKGQRTVAAQQKVNIDTLRQYAQDPHLVTGPPGDLMLKMQRMASALGIGDKTQSASTPREMFNMLAAKVLADQFAGIRTLSTQEGEKGGRVFKPMLDIEEKANITSGDSVPGILRKLDFIDQLGDHQIRWGDAVNDYERKYGKGSVGPEFEKWLMDDVAKTKITPREYKEPMLVNQHGNREPMPAPGGARSQAEAVGVLPGGTPKRGVTELNGAVPPSGTPPPRIPQGAGPGASMPVPTMAGLFGQKPPQGPYMSAEGQLVLPNDAAGNPEKWIEYAAPVVGPLGAYKLATMGARAAGAGPLLSKLAGGGAAVGAHGDWPFILKLLLGEHIAKKMGLD